MNAQQINGQRFNRLTVIRRAGTSIGLWKTDIKTA